MGATAGTLLMRGRKSGRPYSLSLYFAGADAAQYIAPASFAGVAIATSDPRWVVPEPVIVTGWQAGPTTGTITIDSDGMATPINMNVAAMIAAAANPNNNFAELKGVDRNGRISYRVRVLGAMSA